MITITGDGKTITKKLAGQFTNWSGETYDRKRFSSNVQTAGESPNSGRGQRRYHDTKGNEQHIKSIPDGSRNKNTKKQLVIWLVCCNNLDILKSYHELFTIVWPPACILLDGSIQHWERIRSHFEFIFISTKKFK